VLTDTLSAIFRNAPAIDAIRFREDLDAYGDLLGEAEAQAFGA
jgi:hypothetical protein